MDPDTKEMLAAVHGMAKAQFCAGLTYAIIRIGEGHLPPIHRDTVKEDVRKWAEEAWVAYGGEAKVDEAILTSMLGVVLSEMRGNDA